jgi:hypothetical protein
MMTSLVSPRHWTLERAMREWARSDESVAASVRAGDRRLLRAVRQAFQDYVFDQEVADVRTSATFAASVGFCISSTPRSRRAGRRARRGSSSSGSARFPY